jgi:hypothetical protein
MHVTTEKADKYLCCSDTLPLAILNPAISAVIIMKNI